MYDISNNHVILYTNLRAVNSVMLNMCSVVKTDHISYTHKLMFDSVKHYTRNSGSLLPSRRKGVQSSQIFDFARISKTSLLSTYKISLSFTTTH